jgi:hypothetical protein
MYIINNIFINGRLMCIRHDSPTDILFSNKDRIRMIVQSLGNQGMEQIGHLLVEFILTDDFGLMIIC